MARQQERFARLREANQLIRKLWSRRVTFRVSIRPRRRRSRQAGQAGADLCRRAAGPQVAKYAGRSGQVHLRPARTQALHRDAAAERGGGLKLARNPPADYDRLIEMKVSFDTDHERAMQDTALGSTGADAQEKMSVEDPTEMERLSAARRWSAPPGGGSCPPSDGRREDPAVRRDGFPPPGVSRPGRTRALPAATASRFAKLHEP
jgi:coenzyme F420-dependent glucose-6-phosphate dehydrogenase